MKRPGLQSVGNNFPERGRSDCDRVSLNLVTKVQWHQGRVAGAFRPVLCIEVQKLASLPLGDAEGGRRAGQSRGPD